MSFDVARARGLYPTVGTGTAHLDGPFNTLQPESVIRAIIATLRAAPAQVGSSSAGSRRSGQALAGASRAVADLVGGRSEDVVIGSSIGAVLLQLSDAISADWQLGDEVVVNRLDSDSALRPWLRAARRSGVGVRWAEVDLDTGELPSWQYERLIGRRTRLVTVPLVNPATGVITDIATIADRAHRHGALVVVDAGAALPHFPLDLEALGADLLAVAAYTFGGPTVAAVMARPGLLGEIDEFDVGPLPVELLDGFTATVDHLAGLDETATGTRRERLAASITAAGGHTRALYEQLDAGLRRMEHLTVLGSESKRVPVVALTVAGRSPAQVGEALARRGVSVWTGPSDMSELMRAFGADELGGAIFAGVMPHTSAAEVETLLEGLDALH
jgi:cysteine desulfurase family protein (TIGR01976 family)